MTKSVTKIQDKDTRKRLSVVRSKEDPTKYWVVILNPDWSKIKWPKGDPGPQWCPGPEGPSICDAQFSGVDIVFEKTNGCCVVLEDAATCLQWPQWCTWNGICCTTLNADYTLTLQYTNGCCDTTGSIRGCQWEQWNPGPTWNGICCTTCSKVWKTTTVQFDYTNWTDFCFSVQDGQDGQGSGDMLACVYDPCNCAKDTFDYDNFYNTPDLTCYQEKLTAWNWIDITSNTISTTFVYWESTTAAATVQKVVNIPSITELNVGQVIIVKPTVTSTVANSTLKVNNFDAYGMLYNGASITTSTDSIVWTANVPSMFILDEVSGTKYWRFLWHWLDSNSTYTLNRLIDPSRYHVWTGTYAFSRYSLVMEKADWTREKITNTAAAYSTWTSKTANTNWFRLWHIRYYNTTSNLANWALVASSAIDTQAPSVTAAYSFNCGTVPWWAVWTPIYLVGSMWADWLFYLDTTQRWSTTLPGAKDWKLYIKLWTSLSADNSTFSLITEKPIYYYDNWIKVYRQADNKADKSSLGTAAYCNTWTCCWEVPVLNSYWKLCTSILPWVALTDTFVVANKSDLTSLSSAEQWDIWIVTAESKTYVLSAEPYSTEANWKELLSPTDAVTSVNGQTGAVCINIPTDNCQLWNGCWYTTCTWTVSSCADIISKLWYTPYSSANPNWYTSCTWTLTADNICDAAFSSSWDWVATKAPSMNAVYDVLWDVETLLANI